MNKTIWHDGPPPSIGWWPASCEKRIKTLRLWNGKWWSRPAFKFDSAETAAHYAMQKAFAQKDIQWTERWW